MPTAAYAAFDARSPLRSTTVEPRAPGPHDVAIDIIFCGVFHSDLHFARSEWFPANYPVIPGHEIIGRVTGLGADVTRFSTGQLVGVGCLVDSCRTCPSCREHLENYCTGGATMTYGSPDPVMGGMTAGGYSTDIVVNEDFVLSIPENLDPAAAAPLLCAGITTFSPLRHWNVGPGTRVGVVGLGGLGHMAVQLAAAMGAEVTVFTTSPAKAADAASLGAASTVVSTDAAAMKKADGTLDFIVDTVAAQHQLDPLLSALKRDGVLCLVGVPPTPHPPHSAMDLIFHRKTIAGSLIGGIQETQEMLDFCGNHGITAGIEVIRMGEINSAWERMLMGDVKYRFVIDMGSLKES
jgi:uncharacterized zinc-type alcohol dehydrogenase-like protein